MLREISLLWSMIHALVIFILLFESRYSKKKTMLITVSTMAPLIAANTVLAFVLPADKMGVLLLATLSLPSLIVFWIVAKKRDGRFFFTFCLVDTIVLEIIYITQILNYYITPESNIFMFAVRLVIFLPIEVLVYKFIRKDYLEVQKVKGAGWGVFAVVGALFYVLMTVTMSYPTVITERPEYLPAAVLLFVLIPVIYIHIIITLYRQQKMHSIAEQENILRLHVNSLTSRMEEMSAADDRFRVERHNFRHKLKTIAGLIRSGHYDECLTLLDEYNMDLEKTKIKRYCQHAVLDAVLSYYIQKAKDKDIEVEMGFAFPDTLAMSETELATAIANALENAVNACEQVETGRRHIDIKVIDHPRFIIQIANSYVGDVEFDENDIPINHDSDHGFGTRFIAAFCQKNGGFYQFTADGERFCLYLNF